MIGPIRHIQAAVARRFGVTMRGLLSHCRLRRFLLPRQIAMFLAREITRKSFPQIGRRFHRDQSTIQYAMRKISALLVRNPDIAKIVASLRAELQGVV